MTCILEGGQRGGWGRGGWEVNFDCLSWKVEGGDFEKLKEGGGGMVQDQVFLKEDLPLHHTSRFQSLSILHLEITLPFAKLCYAFEEKNIFFCHHNFMKKSNLMLSKNEPKNIQ